MHPMRTYWAIRGRKISAAACCEIAKRIVVKARRRQSFLFLFLFFFFFYFLFFSSRFFFLHHPSFLTPNLFISRIMDPIHSFNSFLIWKEFLPFLYRLSPILTPGSPQSQVIKSFAYNRLGMQVQSLVVLFITIVKLKFSRVHY